MCKNLSGFHDTHSRSFDGVASVFLDASAGILMEEMKISQILSQFYCSHKKVPGGTSVVQDGNRNSHFPHLATAYMR